MAEINIKRIKGDFGFEAKDSNGHSITMDANPEIGGVDFGVRPMQVLLIGLGGCSGIDIVMILKKQRQVVKDFSMKIEGERENGKEPSLWKNITIVFELTGEIEKDKAERACELSMQKYCSVAETLRKSGTSLTWKVKVNGQ
ncbi:MAG: OsmC family protein [Ferruginibacter sp.]|nr:OsmC family protein [Ferruginibacter sp.]